MSTSNRKLSAEDVAMRDYLGLSDEYWNRISDRERALYQVVRPTPAHLYEVDVAVSMLPMWIESNREDLESAGGTLELNPDFQRGHVWTAQQRTRYVEAVLRGQAEPRILFNCPGYVGAKTPVIDIAPNTMQCIDGLQRLTALTEYQAGRVPVFGGMTVSDFAGTAFDSRRLRSKMRVYGMGRRADLLGFYLDLNEGGTIHSDDELSRVRALLQAAESNPPLSTTSVAGHRKSSRPRP